MLSPSDAELVQRERNLPGLRLLLDCEAFVAALDVHVPQLRAARAAAHYVRYKPGTSCLVAYRVQDHEGATIELYAKAFRADETEKFRKAAMPRGPRPAGIHGPFAVPALLTVIRLLPDDGEVEALALLADPGERAKLFSKLLPAHPQWHQGALRRLAYKPERRYVAQLSSPDGVPRAVIKFHSAAGFEKMSRNAKLQWSGDTLRVAQRLGRSMRYKAVAMEWLEGDLLVDRLPASGFESSDVRRVGRALGELHAYKKKLAPAKSREEEAADLPPIASAVASAYPGAASRISLLATGLGDWLLKQPPAARMIHGDFYAKQVLLQPGGTVAFLDLDEACRGDPAADLGNFIAHLERHALCGRIDARRAEQVAAALRSGYADAGGRVTDEAVRMYTATCLLLLSPQPFRDRQLGWPQHIDRILDRVEALAQNPSGRCAFVSCGSRWHADDIVVESVPGAQCDAAMPFLKRALDPSEMQRALDVELVRADDSRERLDLRRIRLARHKPGRRCLIEYDVESSTREPFTLVAKVRAKALDEATYALNVALRRCGFDDDAADGVSVPEPVGTIRSLNMWLQRKVPGVAATELLGSPCGPAIAARLADVAHKLHAAGMSQRRRHTIDDELRILHERLPLVAQANPSLGRRVLNLLEACDRLGHALPTVAERGVHRDFYPDQVSVAGDRLYLLDLDLYCLGDPVLDIGNCAGHILEYRLRRPELGSVLEACEKSLADRYLCMTGSHLEEALSCYMTLSLARHVHISTTFPDRAQFTESILCECEKRLPVVGPALSRRFSVGQG